MYSGYRHVNSSFAYGAFTLFGRLSQNLSARLLESIMRSEPHKCMHRGLASFAFARRYSRNRCFFLFLRLLRCFSSPGSLPYVMDWRMDDWSFSSRVSPFRYLRIDGYLLLPAAFRSLSRLSSALSAKASTLRSFLLDLFRCIALHHFVSTSSEIDCFLELIKTFVSTFGLLFSDVLNISLKNFQLSLCMKFSRYIRY